MELLIALLPLLAVFAGFAANGWFAQRATTGAQKVLRFLTGLFILATAVSFFLGGQVAALYIVAAVWFGATSFVVERRYRAQHFSPTAGQ